MCCGEKAVVSFKRWKRGLREREGIEWDKVGHRFVGGSYLPFYLI